MTFAIKNVILNMLNVQKGNFVCTKRENKNDIKI